MFKDELSQEQLGLYATRLYLVLMTTCIFVLAAYSSAEIRTNTFTMRQPSLATFERLNTYYATTLQCPCAQVSVRHDKIFNISVPRLHQVRKQRSREFLAVVRINTMCFLRSFFCRMRRICSVGLHK